MTFYLDSSAVLRYLLSGDALHLATALRWRDITKERIRMISYDKQLLICAEAFGIRRFPDGIGLSSE